MLKKLAIFLAGVILTVAITIPIISHSMTVAMAMWTPPQIISGGYRYWQVYDDTINGSTNDAGQETYTFPGVADLILISWEDATGPLHVQFYTSDDDSTFVKPSSVAYVEPGETFPFYMRDITSIKVDSVVDSDNGEVRVNWYAI